MQRSFRLLSALFCPVAIGLYLLLATWGGGEGLAARDIRGLVAFAFVALVAEMMAVDFRFGPGKQQPRSSMAFLPFLGMIAIYDPHITLLAVVGVVGASQLLFRRNDLLRAAYNMAQAAITAGVAGFVYHALDRMAGFHFLFSFSIAAAVFFATNILLTGIAISYLKSAAFSGVIAHIATGLRYDFLASPIAAFPVLLYDTYEISILVVVWPLLLIHYFHVSKQQVLDAHTDLIRALVKAIETRDPYTSGHSVRVSTLATLIAKDLGLPVAAVRTIETAALLHDIGKIDPAFSEVLRKPFELSADERTLIQTHAAKGASMLQGLRSVHPEVVQAVHHHHERFDGNGYPAGIAGSDIPLAARIIMLCDSVDAMLSDRPYRKALSIADVHAELARCAGSQFDPAVVNVVVKHGTLAKAVALLSDDVYPPSAETYARHKVAS
jgi:putative nucleotidyltransferase with HDIG domain